MLFQVGLIVLEARYFFAAFIPFATAGICSAAIEVGQNPAMLLVGLATEEKLAAQSGVAARPTRRTPCPRARREPSCGRRWASVK